MPRDGKGILLTSGRGWGLGLGRAMDWITPTPESLVKKKRKVGERIKRKRKRNPGRNYPSCKPAVARIRTRLLSVLTVFAGWPPTRPSGPAGVEIELLDKGLGVACLVLHTSPHPTNGSEQIANNCVTDADRKLQNPIKLIFARSWVNARLLATGRQHRGPDHRETEIQYELSPALSLDIVKHRGISFFHLSSRAATACWCLRQNDNGNPNQTEKTPLPRAKLFVPPTPA
ncbi:hypothetical protein VTI74DRAFT_6464 [Chaetomium olivicolor]